MTETWQALLSLSLLHMSRSALLARPLEFKPGALCWRAGSSFNVQKQHSIQHVALVCLLLVHTADLESGRMDGQADV